MTTFGFWQRELLLLWHQHRAPMAAAAVALAAWGLGRLLRSARLEAAAAGLALCVGWAVALGGVFFVLHVPAAERLPVLALAAVAAGLVADRSGRAAGLAGIVLALAGGWWLAGAPTSEAAALAVLPGLAGLAMAMLLALWLLRGQGPWCASTGALALWGALAVAGAPAPWTVCALVLLAAGLGQLGSRGAAASLLPLVAGLVGLAGLVVLAAGRLGRGGVSRFDLAALAPVLAIWAMPRLQARLPWAGGLLAAVAAAGLAVALAWAGVRFGFVH